MNGFVILEIGTISHIRKIMVLLAIFLELVLAPVIPLNALFAMRRRILPILVVGNDYE
jgi:hypothetical protein